MIPSEADKLTTVADVARLEREIQPPRPTEPPLVGVEWDDAHGSVTNEISPQDGTLSSFHKPHRVVTYGLLMREDDHGITLAMEDLSDDDYRGPTFIPRSLIRSDIWVVSAHPRRKRRMLK